MAPILFNFPFEGGTVVRHAMAVGVELDADTGARDRAHFLRGHNLEKPAFEQRAVIEAEMASERFGDLVLTLGIEAVPIYPGANPLDGLLPGQSSPNRDGRGD